MVITAEYVTPFQDTLARTKCFCCFCQDFLACGELDPLNRRLGSEKKPDVVVQVRPTGVTVRWEGGLSSEVEVVPLGQLPGQAGLQLQNVFCYH